MTKAPESRSPEVDRVLDVWASIHGLSVNTREHWDAIVKSIPITDSGGDLYELYAGRNYDETSEHCKDEEKVAVAGASLVKRGSSMHHAFKRERERFSFRQTSTLEELSSTLDGAFEQVRMWAAQAGHTLGEATQRKGAPSDA